MAVKVGSFAKTTAAATASQAITGVGFKPRALILWTDGSSTSADTWTDSYRFAIGYAARNAADSITVGSVSGASEDAAATSNASRRAATKALTIVEWSEAVAAECDLSSFDTDGFTLSWTTNNASAYVINYMALGGALLTNAYVKAWTTGTSNGAVAMTGVGFQPDSVLHLQGPHGALPATLANSLFTIGAMTSTAQWDSLSLALDNRGDSDTARQQSPSYALVSITQAGVNDYTGAYASMDADGFTVTIASTPTQSFNVFSLCLKGGSFKLGSILPPAATGTVSYTGIGFQPEGVLFSNIGSNSESTTGIASAVLCIGATNGTSDASAILNDHSSQAASNSAGMSSASYCVLVEVVGNQGTPGGLASIETLGADGFTLDWTRNEVIANIPIYYFAFAGGAAAGGMATKAMHYKRMRTQ